MNSGRNLLIGCCCLVLACAHAANRLSSEHLVSSWDDKDGTAKTLSVRRDVDLGKRKIGEKLVFQVAEMIAIDVRKP